MTGTGDDAERTTTSRRGLLESVATTGIAGGLAAVLSRRDLVQPVRAEGTDPDAFAADAGADPDRTFPQSVASGGPTRTGVILWTRIDPDAHDPGVDLGVEVARDEAFEDVVHRGTVDAEDVSASHDYAVKVDLDGHLEPDSFFYYRFTYDGTRSRVGRCRTLPGPDASPESMSFGVVTCQHYQNGYFPAYHHLAGEDVDFLLHLGDFIYETADDSYLPPGVGVTRDLELPGGERLPQDVDGYRSLYKTYKSDRFLQEALERHTLIAGWDDHEVANDRYWNYAADAPAVPPYDDADPEFAVEITADAIQAWVEHVPARVEYDPSGGETLHEQFRLWREFSFGDLVDLAVVDERLYRDQPVCEEFTVGCSGQDAPDRTMLGAEQKEWFLDWAEGSTAEWTVWQNEVLCMPLTMREGDDVKLFHNSWAGYTDERDEILRTLGDVDNVVALTGDLHASMAGYLQTSYPGDETTRVGVELMTPSVTSINVPDKVDLPLDLEDDFFSGLAGLVNDHLSFTAWYHHGYSTVEFTPEEATWSVYAVDKNVDSPDADRRLLTRQRIPSGEVTVDETPDAAFWTSSREVGVGDTVAFDATPSEPPPEGTIERYEWEFGDGSSATGWQVDHSYDAPGRYTVTLRVTDRDGTVDSAGARVVVGEGCSTEETTTVRGTVDPTGRTTHAYDLRTDDPCSVRVAIDGPEEADLDLYVTYDGRRPTQVDYDARSVGFGSDERVELDGEDLSPDAQLGILVDSYRGGGEYSLSVVESGR